MLKGKEELKRRKKQSTAPRFKFGYLVHDVSRIRRTVMDQFMRPLGVTRSQWTVLMTLARSGNDGMKQVDLARLLEVGKVTVGGLIDRLEATGHVERRPDPEDRRIKRNFITPQGYTVIEMMISRAKEMNERVMKDISREDRILCEEVLFKVKQNLKQVLLEIGHNGPQEEFGSELRELEVRE